MPDELFARELYGRWDHFFAHACEKVADSVLQQFDHPDYHIIIEHLNLDLGVIKHSEWDEQFPIRLRSALEDALQRSIHAPVPEEKMIRQQNEVNIFSILTYFLLHGTLPWYTSQKYYDITFLFREVLTHSSALLKSFLIQYGHYTGLQQRLVFQLRDPELEDTVYLLRSSESSFIISYVRFVCKKYPKVRKQGITQADYRYAVWQVVYAWMLTDRSSVFDRKSFLSHTLASLASRLNLSYSALLEKLTENILNIIHRRNELPELYRLLFALRKENEERLFQEARFDTGKLQVIIAKILQQGLHEAIVRRNRDWLMDMLRHGDSCRQVLNRLSEEEIIDLVPVVIPAESDFVIHYARLLDRQKDKGVLEGKAGGEFKRLKWMFIFPLVIAGEGSAFNRKQFVLSVLKQIAAHYNLTVDELLAYFLQQTVFSLLSPVLQGIVEELFEESTAYHMAASGNTLRLLLGQPARAMAYLQSLDEKQRYNLIDHFEVREKQFVIAYARSLDRQYRRGILEGKAGRDFNHIKWYFIFLVLHEPAGNRFNRRYFVRDVLRHIAARYNLRYMEILRYFHGEEEQQHLPVALRAVFRELFIEEKQQLIAYILRVGSEADKYRIIEWLSPEDQKFLRSVLRLMDELYISSVSRYSGLNHLKWEIIESLLRKSPGSIHRRTFLQKLTERLSDIYHVEFSDFNKILSNLLRQSKKKYPSDLKQTIMEYIRWDSPKPGSSKDNSNDQWQVMKNAGLVLLAPFLPRLFQLLDLIDRNEFASDDAKIRTIHLMQYLVKNDIQNDEPSLLLNKLLVNYPLDKSLPSSVELNDKEKELAQNMLKAVLQYWPKLSRSSTRALSDAFLQREGRIEIKDDHYLLTVEEKAYDILLDGITWNFRIIKFPWMDKRIEVKWRG